MSRGLVRVKVDGNESGACRGRCCGAGRETKLGGTRPSVHRRVIAGVGKKRSFQRPPVVGLCKSNSCWERLCQTASSLWERRSIHWPEVPPCVCRRWLEKMTVTFLTCCHDRDGGGLMFCSRTYHVAHTCVFFPLSLMRAHSVSLAACVPVSPHESARGTDSRSTLAHCSDRHHHRAAHKAGGQAIDWISYNAIITVGPRHVGRRLCSDDTVVPPRLVDEDSCSAPNRVPPPSFCLQRE